MKGKLVMAIMYGSNDLLDKTKEILQQKYSPISKESSEFDFNHTTYYEEEFGTNLKKRFIAFEKEISEAELADIKHEITQIEKELSQNNKRTINIDPGYLNEKELVLASFKQRNEVKTDIGKSVYAHKVIEVVDNKPTTFPHTFKDYKEHIDFFFPQ